MTNEILGTIDKLSTLCSWLQSPGLPLLERIEILETQVKDLYKLAARTPRR